MADQNDPQMTRDDANIHLGFTYLREDLQEMRQDLRELTREMNSRFDDMAQRMDHRFNRQTATVISLAAAIIAAVRL